MDNININFLYNLATIEAKSTKSSAHDSFGTMRPNTHTQIQTTKIMRLLAN